MSTARFIVGDTRRVLATLPDASVDLVLTSPPFLALRSYLPADHPDKALEMGSEPTPGEFIDGLLDVVEACDRVLAPHGSMCIELGDTYSGSGGAGGDYAGEGARNGQPRWDGSASRSRADGNGKVFRGGSRQPDKQGDGWPVDKSLCLIPELFRVALVYGFNPLTGRQTPRWRARNVIRWCRPNPPVGALGDKVRPATSDMVVICKARDRYFDLDAVRDGDYKPRSTMGKVDSRDAARAAVGLSSGGPGNDNNPAGAPPLDHWWHDDDSFDQDAWLLSTQPYRGSHYATFPESLCVRPIEAMCPPKVCQVCGQPSRRIVQSESIGRGRSNGGITRGEVLGQENRTGSRLPDYAEHVTLGWSDCGHDDWRPGVVLDPFAGSGTTLAVAVGHSRDAIGIDLDARNADLAAQRVGMFLTVETPDGEGVA